MVPHKVPTLPYQKVCIALFQVQDRTFLLVVDYLSNFPEISELQNTSNKSTIQTLKQNFLKQTALYIYIYIYINK